MRQHLGLNRGRCIGHGAIPIFAEEKPYDVLHGLAEAPSLVAETQLKVRDGAYEHGFALVSLGNGGGKAKIEYFTERGINYAEEF